MEDRPASAGTQTLSHTGDARHCGWGEVGSGRREHFQYRRSQSRRRRGEGVKTNPPCHSSSSRSLPLLLGAMWVLAPSRPPGWRRCLLWAPRGLRTRPSPRRQWSSPQERVCCAEGGTARDAEAASAANRRENALRVVTPSLLFTLVVVLLTSHHRLTSCVLHESKGQGLLLLLRNTKSDSVTTETPRAFKVLRLVAGYAMQFVARSILC